MKISIIGGGMAGLACAERLSSAGMAVTVFDKGRAAGGRMAARRVATEAGEASFDHGAQYFNARDPAFAARVRRWADAGLAARWPAAGPDAWVGMPTMNAPVKQMASVADVRWNTAVPQLGRVSGGWSIDGEAFDAVVVAVPAEQAAPLLQPWDPAMAARAAATPSQPCWTVMAAFAAPVPHTGDILREQGAIGWAARNSAKPGRAGPEAWVIQAAPGWSTEHLEEDAQEVGQSLLQTFATAVGRDLPPTLSVTAHRWRYARAGIAPAGAAWNPTLRLGVCGDWLMGPRVECAWLSGDTLAGSIAAGA